MDQLKPEERSYLHDQLRALMACKGRSCTVAHNSHAHGMQKAKAVMLPPVSQPLPQRYRRRKVVDDFRNGKISSERLLLGVSFN